MALISYIIPHKNRNGILETHLKALQNQILKDFEIIVVDDGSDIVPDGAVVNQYHPGPGGARSYGASLATGDIIVFVGDDTLPSEDLLLRHWFAHRTNPDVDVVQGYTMFHPSVMGTHFMEFLDKSGFQANWQSLKEKDGSWKRDVTGSGFFLTTNVSVKTASWQRIGDFDKRFNKAAWEDIEMGVRLQRNHYRTLFESNATNFHLHGYNYASFCQRQFTEGKERINVCLAHPEMGAALVQPQAIRDVMNNAEAVEVINNGSDIANLAIPKLREIQYGIWGEGLQIMSILGLIDEINRRGSLYQILKHLHVPEEVTMVFFGVRAIEKGDLGYAQHVKVWMLDKKKNDWAVYMFAAEIDKLCGDMESAQYFWKKAREIAPSEEWVKQWFS
jgi:hypothetical protein